MDQHTCELGQILMSIVRQHLGPDATIVTIDVKDFDAIVETPRGIQRVALHQKKKNPSDYRIVSRRKA